MNRDKVKILVCGNYGVENLGDEAILAGLLRLIESAFPGSEVTAMSSDPLKTSKNHHCDAIPYFPAGLRSLLKFVFLGQFWKIIAAVKKVDLVILGGGGLFSDEKPRAIWIWWVQACWFYLLRKKVVCIGQSVGPLKSKWARKITASVFKKMALVAVRDQKSADLLKELAVKKVEVIADAAYAIGYDRESFHKKNAYVVLTLREWIKGDVEKIDIELKKFIEWLWQEKRLRTVFIPFQEKVDSDVERFELLNKLIGNEKVFSLKSAQGDFREALDIIARANYVIGMRLHSVIFAVLTKRPFLALSYSTKVRDFVKTLGLENWLNYEEISFEELKKKFEEMENNYEHIEKVLEAKKLHFTYEFFKQEKMLRQLVNKE